MVALSGCGSSTATGNSASLPVTSDNRAVITRPSPGESRSTGSSVGRIMNYLASDNLQGREAGSRGIEMAALFIEDQFRVNRVPPYFASYRDTLSNFTGTAFNMVGVVEGNNPDLRDEFILIGAHYDHLGLLRSQTVDSVANGANDNASGTTTVLELARYFGQQRTNGRSIIFALFSAEEKGLLGSAHLARRLKEQGLPLYLMLNFEMTGVPLVNKDYLAYVTGYDKSNLAQICNEYAREKVVGFLPTAEEYSLFQRSDNYPFHTEFKVPSQTFCTFDFTNFDQYHKVGDEVNLMDMDHMAKLVNTFIPIIEGISNKPQKEIIYH